MSDVALKIPGDSSSQTSLFILDATLFHSVQIYMLRFLHMVRSLYAAAAFRVFLVRAATAAIGYCSKNA